MGQIAALTDGHVPMSDEQAEIDDATEIANMLSASDPDRSTRVLLRATYILRQRRVDAGLVIVDPMPDLGIAFSVGRDEGGC